jgi:hypothetical protein
VVAVLPKRHRNVPELWCSQPQSGEDGKMKDTMIVVDLAKTFSSFTGHR